MAAIIQRMGLTRAVGILDGRIKWTDPREYLEAALYVSINERTCREYMAASLYKIALMLADYAVDHGEEAAVALITEATKPENTMH